MNTYMKAGECLKSASRGTARPGAMGIILVCLEVTITIIATKAVANNKTLKATSMATEQKLVLCPGGDPDDFNGTSGASMDAMIVGIWVAGS